MEAVVRFIALFPLKDGEGLRSNSLGCFRRLNPALQRRLPVFDNTGLSVLLSLCHDNLPLVFRVKPQVRL